MNQRIKELEPQCWEMTEFGLRFNHEKYAEMIIKECTDVLNKRFMGDLNREDMEVRQCIADVKAHFGVEE